MTEQTSILAGIDPEFTKEIVSRRSLITEVAAKLGVLATPATLLAGCVGIVAGSEPPAEVAAVLNFALTLEYLEDEFYRTGLAAPGLIPAQYQAVFRQISKHESAHVGLLATLLGPGAVPKPTFDFTAGGAFADVFTNPQTFMALAQAFEDTGVRAYKGQAANVIGSDTMLTTALKIHSVEARHAAEVRRIRGQKGWITGDSRGNLPAAAQGVYAGEGVTSQAGVSALGVSAAAASEAFDEPLTREQVLAIASLFIAA